MQVCLNSVERALRQPREIARPRRSLGVYRLFCLSTHEGYPEYAWTARDSAEFSRLIVTMDAEQRYLLDLQGYLHLKKVLSQAELVAARQAADAYSTVAFSGGSDVLAELGLGQKGDGSSNLQHAIAYDRALEWLCWHPGVWPIILELTGSRPQMNGPGTMIVDDVRYTVDDPNNNEIHWHCAREIGDNVESGEYDAPRARAAASCKVREDGTMSCNNFVVL